MYYVPAEWLLGGLAEGWCFGMFITAGRCSRPHSGSSPRTYVEDQAWTTQVVLTTALAIAGLAAVITFAVS